MYASMITILCLDISPKVSFYVNSRQRWRNLSFVECQKEFDKAHMAYSFRHIGRQVSGIKLILEARQG